MRKEAIAPDQSRRRRSALLFVEELEGRVLPALFFVSPTGSDSNNGTSAGSPWRTLGRVTQSGQIYQPGDQILLQGGQTFTGTLAFGQFNWRGTAASPVRISSYGTGRATIQAPNASQPSVLTFYDIGGVTVQNLNVRGPGISVGNFYHGINFIDRVNDIGTTTDRYRGIIIDQVDAGFVSGSAIDFYSPRNTAADPAILGYGDIRITNATLHDSREAGLTFLYRGLQGYYPYSNVYVSQVTSFNNPGSVNSTNGFGLAIGGVETGTIENCVVRDNGALSGNATIAGGSGIATISSRNIVVQYCEAFNSFTNLGNGVGLHGHGINFDWGTENSTMQYNYAHDNFGAGLFVTGFSPIGVASINQNNIVRFNASENNGRKNRYGELSIYGRVRNLDVYNNTLYARNFEHGQNTAFRAINDQVQPSYENIRVTNNIFQTGDNVSLLVIDAGLNGSVPGFNGNVYWNENAQFAIFYLGVRYNRLSDSRATGQERLNGGDTGFHGDPEVVDIGNGGIFTNPGNFDALTQYRLEPDSPIQGKGLNLNSVFGIDPGNSDLFGQPLIVDPFGRTRTNRTPNPGADSFLSRYTETLLADSVADFSSTQGFRGWTYGQSDAQAGSAFPAVANFTPMQFNGAIGSWEGTGGPGSPVLSPFGGQPGFSGNQFNAWPVRRWVSTETGYFNLSGTIEHEQTKLPADGTTLRLYHNGAPIHVQLTGPSTTAFRPQFFYSVNVWVNAGDVIDMAIDPRGNPSYDFTNCTMRVTTVPGDIALLAHTQRDFAGTQNSPDASGLGRWQYGSYTTPSNPSTFSTSGWAFANGNWTNGSQQFSSHKANTSHPGPGQPAVRRWTSAIAQDVEVDLNVRRANETFSTNANGVVVQVFLNSALVQTVTIDNLTEVNNSDPNNPDAVQGNSFHYRIPLRVAVGDRVDLVVDARNGNVAFDGTQVSMTISLRTSRDQNYPGEGTIVANSVTDFSGTQGANGWRYGRSDDQIGVANPTVQNFQQLGFFNAGTGRWQVNAGQNNPSLTAFGGHPGFSGSFVNDWAVRRWTSSVSGPATLNGVIRMNQVGPGDGTVARLYRNGQLLFSRRLPPNSSTVGAAFTYSLSVQLQVGDVIDMVIDPGSNPSFDSTDFTMVVAV